MFKKIKKLFGYPKHRLTILCPFHVESTPSCLVDLKKQTLECVGCGKQVNLKDLTEKEREVISLKCAIAKDIESILSK